MRILFCTAILLATNAHAISLERVFARIIENNHEVAQAKFRLEEAAGRRLVLRAEAWPDVRSNIPAGAQGGDRAGEKTLQPFAFALGALQQPILDRAVLPSLRRGNVEVLLAQQRLNVAVLEQLHSARLAYYTAAYQDALRSFVEQQRQRLEANVQAQNDRYQQGQANRAALVSAQVLERELTPRIEESRRASAAALLQLAQAMGDDVRGALPTVDEQLAFVSADVDVENETRRALTQRADLKLARLLVRAAQLDERIAAAGYYPEIHATISGTYIPVTDIRRGSQGSARRSDDIISSELRTGTGYTWRVIDNGLVTGARLRQRGIREANEAVLARLEADVSPELTRIRNNLRALHAQHDALLKASRVAEQTVNAVQAQVVQGLTSQLEYRSAESDFLQTRTGLLSVAYQQNVALAERDRITGRYFQFQAP